MADAEIDWKKLAAEVSARHGMRVDADDPMMAVVTLNRLVFEACVERAVEQLRASVTEIEQSAAKMQVRAGVLLAQELRAFLAERDTSAPPRRPAASDRTSLDRVRWLLIGFFVGGSSAVVALAFVGHFR